MKILLVFIFIVAFPAHAIPTWDPLKIVTNGDMSQASVTSTAIDLTNAAQWSIQAVWSGAPVGTIKLQVSNMIIDSCANVPSNQWSDYTLSIQPVTEAGDLLWNAWTSNFHCLRMVYLKTSGTGTINATYSRK